MNRPSFSQVNLFKNISALVFCLGLLTNCGGTSGSNDGPPLSADEQRKKGFGKLFGEDTLVLGKSKSATQGTGIGVNAFLWRASLEVLSFMPLSQVDPFGGVILTDWYSPPATPDEQFKVDLLILDPQLRSDALKVSAFHQVRKKGTWVQTAVPSEMTNDIEEAILLRARQLKIASLNS